MMNDLLKIWRGVSASTLLVLLSACGSTQDTGIRSGSSTYYADAAVPRAVPITREQLSQGDCMPLADELVRLSTPNEKEDAAANGNGSTPFIVYFVFLGTNLVGFKNLRGLESL